MSSSKRVYLSRTFPLESTDDEEIPATISENSFQSTDLPLWKDLFVPAPVLQALKELHFEEPTPIQRETLPAAIKGRRDVVGAAETGSGVHFKLSLDTSSRALFPVFCKVFNFINVT